MRWPSTAGACAALLLVATSCGPLPRAVLWIGNSLTFHHNQPHLVEQLGAAAGHRVRITSRALPGVSLQQHWDAGTTTDGDGAPTARALVRRCGWSDVVLQEYSDRALTDREAFRSVVRAFVGEIGTACPTARVLLFENWPYATSADWDGDAARLADAYRDVATDVGATVVPDAAAFARVPERERPSLYDDQKHPSIAGAYLAAVVMARTLWPRFPHGDVTPDGLTAGGARRLQQRAHTAIRAWR